MAITPEMIRKKREAMGLTQDQLAALAKTSQQTVDRVEKGITTHSRAMPRIIEVLELQAELSPPSAAYIPPPSPPAMFDPRKQVPVHAAAEGGPEGALIIDHRPFEYVDRPLALQGDDDAYMIVITGDSMRPRYRPGERALVSPRRPRMPGEDHIFRSEDENGDWRALIKELRSTSEAHWTVAQLNPEKIIKLSRKNWQVCHRVVGRADRD